MPTRPADPLGDRETRRPGMEAMLRNLPAQHREIIFATYFGKRTTGEAAALLGIAPAVAKARLYHAMRDLSAMMANTARMG
jgi:DNA-directed RNA polymerase specialized sigma24 family protein